jgi:hypothetical protein
MGIVGSKKCKKKKQRKIAEISLKIEVFQSHFSRDFNENSLDPRTLCRKKSIFSEKQDILGTKMDLSTF